MSVKYEACKLRQSELEADAEKIKAKKDYAKSRLVSSYKEIMCSEKKLM